MNPCSSLGLHCDALPDDAPRHDSLWKRVDVPGPAADFVWRYTGRGGTLFELVLHSAPHQSLLAICGYEIGDSVLVGASFFKVATEVTQ